MTAFVLTIPRPRIFSTLSFWTPSNHPMAQTFRSFSSGIPAMSFSGTGRRRRRRSRSRVRRGGSAPAPRSRWASLLHKALPVAKCAAKEYLGLGRRRRSRRSRRSRVSRLGMGKRRSRRVRGGDFWSSLGSVASSLAPIALPLAQSFIQAKASGRGRRRRPSRGGRRRIRGGDFWGTLGNIGQTLGSVGQSLLPIALPLAQSYIQGKASGRGRRRSRGSSHATKIRNLAKARAAKRRYAGSGRRRRSSRRRGMGEGLYLPGSSGYGLFA